MAETLTMTEFVMARIKEKEAPALWVTSPIGLSGISAPPVVRSLSGGGIAGLYVDPASVLAECAAMRKIVEGHSGLDASATPNTHCEWCGDGGGGYCPVPYPCDTVLLLASIWSDHPDFREEWRP